MFRFWWLGEKPAFCARIFPRFRSYGSICRGLRWFSWVLTYYEAGPATTGLFSSQVWLSALELSVFFMFLHPRPHFPDPVERMKGTVVWAHLSAEMPHGVTDWLRGQTGMFPSDGAMCVPWDLALTCGSSKCQGKPTVTLPWGRTVVLANDEHGNCASERRGS